MAGAAAKPFVDAKIKQRKVMMFSKTQSPQCHQVRELLKDYKFKPGMYECMEIECRQDTTQIENYFQIVCQTDTRAVPQIFIGGKYRGGYKEILELHESGRLKQLCGAAGAMA